ncbi:hypothetical protein V9N52_001455 [Vibrio navarrensis]
MPLYENLGFTNHPFVKTNADEEPDLENYFVAPPYFDAVVGDASLPSASVVLAPRGAGKTALRRMVESQAVKSQFLAVTYDRFEFGADQTVDDVTLQYHLRNIITRVLVSFLSYLSDHPDVSKGFSREEKKQLSLFVSTYLGDLTGDRVQELMKELKSLPEKFKTFWSNNVGFMEPVINFILKSNGLDKIDLPDVKQEEKRLTDTYKYQMELLLNLVRKLNFKSIYILIDRVDETEKTGNNPEASYRLIQPIIKDLELLGIGGYGFKFFLWDRIEPYYKIDARPDRVQQYRLGWNRLGLKNILKQRLLAYSDQKIDSLNSLLVTPMNIDLDDAICIMANSSPRNMIRFCESILAHQAERDVSSRSISAASIDQASVVFSGNLCSELYGEDIMRSMQKIGKELFTISYVANDVLKVSGQAVRNKITTWISSGILQQVGTIVVPPAKKPVNFYCVVDPSAVRVMHRTETFESFINDRWLPCDHCMTENLFDIELYAEGNDPSCRNCGREIL